MMKLTLTDDDGTVLGSWYIPDEETPFPQVKELIEFQLPAYLNREEYERLKGEK